jgi:hypothetical protein
LGYAAAATFPDLLEVTAALPPAGTVVIGRGPAEIALPGWGARLMVSGMRFAKALVVAKMATADAMIVTVFMKALVLKRRLGAEEKSTCFC